MTERREWMGGGARAPAPASGERAGRDERAEGPASDANTNYSTNYSETVSHSAYSETASRTSEAVSAYSDEEDEQELSSSSQVRAGRAQGGVQGMCAAREAACEGGL